MSEVAGEAVGVAGLGVFIVLDGPVRKEDRQERAGAVDLQRETGGICEVLVSLFEDPRFLLECSVEFRVLLQDGQLCKARRGGNRVAGQCARLVDGTGGGDEVHELRTSAVGGEGHASADDLAEGDEVRRDTIVFGRAAEGEPEAGDDLVEDEQGTVCRADVPQEREEAVLRRDDAHVGGDRFHDDGGNVVVRAEQRLD